MKIAVWCGNGMVGGDRHDVIEVEDDATDEEIEEEAREWFWNVHEFGWEKVPEEKITPPSANRA